MQVNIFTQAWDKLLFAGLGVDAINVYISLKRKASKQHFLVPYFIKPDPHLYIAPLEEYLLPHYEYKA